MSQTRSRSKSSVCGVTLEMLPSSLIASRSLRCTVASPSLVQAVPCHRPRSSVAEACVSAAFVARLERMFSACVCLFPAFVGCFHGSHAGSSFTVTSLTFLKPVLTAWKPDRRLCLPPLGRLRCPCTGLRIRTCHGQKPANVRKCRDHGPSQRRHVVSLRDRCRHGIFSVDIAEKKSRCQAPHSQFRGHLIDKQYRAGGEHGILEDERCADDGLFQERFSPARSHLRPLQASSTSYKSKTFEERGGSVCIERGCGPRMCHCAHHGNCSLLINARRCDHPPRARRSDCVSGDSSQCRQGEAQRNHCQRFHHEGDGEVSEAGSKLTDTVVRQLLLSRSV